MTSTPAEPRKRITIERTYDASLDDVWDLWTTREGIESWWGPEGFSVEVLELELRPQGRFRYAMTAIAEPQIGFMKRAGMALTTTALITYVEVTPLRRLSLLNRVDFAPGLEPYDTATLVELEPVAGGVRMVLTLEAMHDEDWTGRMVAGWNSQIGKLGKALSARVAPGARGQ